MMLAFMLLQQTSYVDAYRAHPAEIIKTIANFVHFFLRCEKLKKQPDERKEQVLR